MKITVDVDCTPEEARRFMGLPDMSSVHEVYLSQLRRSMEEGVTPETITKLMQLWSPMGDASMAMWRKMFDQAGGSGKA